MSIQVLLPGVLADLAGGARRLTLHPPPADVAALLTTIGDRHPTLARRLCDETGAIRRHVNIYVDGTDVRGEQGLATPVPDGAVVQVLPSVAGG
jgi:molybdopterin converting factor small subunit